MIYYRSLNKLTESFKTENGYLIPLKNGINVEIYNETNKERITLYVNNDEHDFIEFYHVNKDVLDGYYLCESDKKVTYKDLILSCYYCSNSKPNPQYAICDEAESFKTREIRTDCLCYYLKHNQSICISKDYDFDGIYVYIFSNEFNQKIPHCHIVSYDKSIEIIYDFIDDIVIRTLVKKHDTELFNNAIKASKFLFNDENMLTKAMKYWSMFSKRKFDVDNYIRKNKICIKNEIIKNYIGQWKK